MENNEKKNEVVELLWTSEKDSRSSGNHGATTNSSSSGSDNKGGCGCGCGCGIACCCSIPSMLTKWLCN